MKWRTGIYLIGLLVIVGSCQEREINRDAATIAHLHGSMENLTDVIVHSLNLKIFWLKC
jgi:hypothetical protein